MIPGDAGGGDDGGPVLASIGFATGSTLADEQSGTISIPLVLSAAVAQPVSVMVQVTGGTATRNIDYKLVSTVVDIPAGATTAAVAVQIVEDTVAEGDETIELALASPVGATLGASAHAVTISGQPLPRVGFTMEAMSGPESAPGSLTLTLSTISAVSIDVAFTLAGTATEADLALRSGTITIPAGQLSVPLVLGVVQDAIDEDDETVIVTIVSATNAIVGAIPQLTYTIIDDDAPPSVAFASNSSSVAENGVVGGTIVLSAPSSRMVTVQCVVLGGTAGTADFASDPTVKFNPGETVRPIPVHVVDDALDEDDETIDLHLTTPVNAALGTITAHTLTILDNDPLPTVSFGSSDFAVAESIGTASILVTLSAPSGRTVTVTFAYTTGTAKLGVDFSYATASPLVFSPGAMAQNIDVAIVQDSLDEDDERLHTALTGAINAGFSIGEHVLTIIDDDPSPMVSLDPTGCPASVLEGTASDNFITHQIGLDQPSGRDIIVQIATGGTATRGIDFEIANPITIAAGQTMVPFLLQTYADAIPESDETVDISITSAPGAIIGFPNACTDTIFNDD